MTRATTPTHKFTFPIDPSTFEKILITYKQGKKIVLEKTEKDSIISDMTVLVPLTQEETNLFNSREDVEIQVRVLTYANKALASKKFVKPVNDVLNDEILKKDENYEQPF